MELFSADVLHGGGMVVICSYLRYSRWSCFLLMFYMVVVWSCCVLTRCTAGRAVCCDVFLPDVQLVELFIVDMLHGGTNPVPLKK